MQVRYNNGLRESTFRYKTHLDTNNLFFIILVQLDSKVTYVFVFSYIYFKLTIAITCEIVWSSTSLKVCTLFRTISRNDV